MLTLPTTRVALATLVAALWLAVPAACSPAPRDIPAAIPSVTFVVDATGRNGQPIAGGRSVAYTLSTFQVDGSFGDVRNPQTGEMIRKAPFVGVQKAPFIVNVELSPGIVNTSILVKGNMRKGESLACYVERNGLPVRDALAEDSSTQRLVSGPIAARCAYVVGR